MSMFKILFWFKNWKLFFFFFILDPHIQSYNVPWEVMPRILFIQSNKIFLGHVKVINTFKIQYK